MIWWYIYNLFWKSSLHTLSGKEGNFLNFNVTKIYKYELNLFRKFTPSGVGKVSVENLCETFVFFKQVWEWDEWDFLTTLRKRTTEEKKENNLIRRTNFDN